MGAVTNAAFVKIHAGVKMADDVQRSNAAVAEAKMIRRLRWLFMLREQCDIIDALEVFACNVVGRSWALL